MFLTLFSFKYNCVLLFCSQSVFPQSLQPGLHRFVINRSPNMMIFLCKKLGRILYSLENFLFLNICVCSCASHALFTVSGWLLECIIYDLKYLQWWQVSVFQLYLIFRHSVIHGVRKQYFLERNKVFRNPQYPAV